MDAVLDLGSHSVKVYQKEYNEESFSLRLVATKTWRLIDSPSPLSHVRSVFQEILPYVSNCINIRAIGTEAMRRSPSLERMMIAACDEFGFRYRTIQQAEELLLIVRAATRFGVPVGLTLVNAGGGSIQMLTAKNKSVMYPFGISDLNREFKLLGSPKERRVADCVQWLSEKVPPDIGAFAYTGGERRYLLQFKVPMSENGFCRASDFLAFSECISVREIEDLKANSPHDPDWMTGAIASNCIVLAMLRASGAAAFFPTDFNIAHGLAGSIAV